MLPRALPVWARSPPVRLRLASLQPGRILAASVAKNYISKLLGTWYHSPGPAIKARRRLTPARLLPLTGCSNFALWRHRRVGVTKEESSWPEWQL